MGESTNPSMTIDLRCRGENSFSWWSHLSLNIKVNVGFPHLGLLDAGGDSFSFVLFLALIEKMLFFVGANGLGLSYPFAFCFFFF